MLLTCLVSTLKIIIAHSIPRIKKSPGIITSISYSQFWQQNRKEDKSYSCNSFAINPLRFVIV